MEEEALVLVLTNETKEKISNCQVKTYKKHDVKKLIRGRRWREQNRDL